MKALSVATLLLALASFSSAQNITGTVTNGSTGKPASGDQVSLLALAQGMQEVASTKTDAQGRFSLPAAVDQRSPKMVRVTHDGVNYFPQNGPLMPGVNTTEITVYDAASKIDELTQTVEVDRYQTSGNQLQVIALFAITNASQPPRALAKSSTFEFALPPGTEIDSAYAKSPGGQPVATAANPGSQKNHYSFGFPLRPGETQFQVAYHMPYSGDASFSPKALGDIQHFVVMTPKGMTFEAKDPKQFKSMPDKTGSTIMVVTNVKQGQDLSFRVAGNGEFQPEQQDAQGAGDSGGTQPAANDNRPGGGLGAPIDAPDPLHQYRVYLLGVFALVLVMGGAYVVSKSNQRTQLAEATTGGSTIPRADKTLSAKPVATADRSSLLLDALKEELFQLELDRTQGKISAPEYEKAKAALDETIRRAVARKSTS